MKIQRIQVIVNPAAGQNEEILNTLNKVFQQYEVAWQVSVTNGPGDARQFAEEAAASGVDLVAGYGGDGTLMEIANGLRDSDLPLGILPGGTGNSLARDLRIPFKLADAAELLCQSHSIRLIDVGRIRDDYFLLHVYTGVDPSQLASRESKDKLGVFAYLLPTLRVIKESKLSPYQVTIDGEEIEQDGIVCVIVNALGFGIDPPLKQAVLPDDGLLDLFIFKKDFAGTVESLLSLEVTDEIVQQWQGREISVRCEPPLAVWVDGEAGGETPVTAVVESKKLKIVVPDVSK